MSDISKTFDNIKTFNFHDGVDFPLPSNMSKIPNLFNQNPLIISQGLHSQDWAGRFANVAIDFSYLGDLICPFDGCKVESSFDSGKQSYFGLRLPDNSLIICVHAYPVRKGTFKKGEIVGKCRWHHWHLSILVNNNLDCILNYLDRSIVLKTQSNIYNGDNNHPDCHWDNYLDLNLNINQPISLDIMFQKKVELARTLPEFNQSPLDIQESVNSDPDRFDPTRVVLWAMQAEKNIKILKTEKEDILAQSVLEIKKLQQENQKLVGVIDSFRELKTYVPKSIEIVKTQPVVKNSTTKPFWESKKFWAFTAGLVYTVLSAFNKEMADQVQSVLALVISYLATQGIIDLRNT